jgi:four helix bundle protein
MSEETKTRRYKDLVVWKKAIALVEEIYRITKDFPQDEKFGIVVQMRRAAVSIPSNIAEGQDRRTTREFIHFLSQAEGSVAELETQIIIAIQLGYCEEIEVKAAVDLISQVRKMLNALRRTLTQS